MARRRLFVLKVPLNPNQPIPAVVLFSYGTVRVNQLIAWNY